MGALSLFATHNRAGEITYRHINGLTYEITVNIFSDPTSPAFQRQEIVMNWGDNTGLDSVRQTIVFPKITDKIQKRAWVVQHTFPGPGNYVISVTDPNRNGGVDNIDNSSGVPFYISSLLRISPLGSLRNNSPVLLNDPIDNACAGQIFVHNPGAVDPDGDSLAYEISASFGNGGLDAPGYTFPPSSTPIFVNPTTGDMVMDVPNAIGLYNVAILIKEFRNGIQVGNVLRDLQIRVFPGCNNSAPVIQSNSLYCVEAGNQLGFAISATDPNAVDDITLTATGEPLLLSGNPASFNQTVLDNPASATFIWNTNCSNARTKLYDLSIKAEDNAVDSRNVSTNLSSFKSIGIRVIAPGPENAMANPQGTGILLNWDNIACPNAEGFNIYRRIDSSGYVSANCIPGVPDGIGYRLIAQLDNVTNTSYLDDDAGEGLIPGRKYCYFISKYFADGDESYVSDEICAEIDQIVPLMTQVSVNQTDVSTGEIMISWTPPDSLDTLAFPPPYRYVIEERDPNGSRIVDSTEGLNNTDFTIPLLNTESVQYEYRVLLYSLGNGRQLSGRSSWASSVFLNLTASDNQIELNWNTDVPWFNQSFTIFRRLPNAATFDSLTTIDSLSYIDENLTNGQEYCYYVKTYGSYGINGVDSPLINLSQINCEIPIDTTPPCAPSFRIDAECEFDNLEINWSISNPDCASDVVQYRVYRSATIEGDFELVTEINDPLANSVVLNGEVAGCYYVSAIDSSMNESAFSYQACSDYCPIYDLPNVFTPNDDGKNDLFVPLPGFRYVDSVYFQVYNRWDQKVFETDIPELNWNGENLENGELLSDGVYFFICEVYEQSIEGPQLRIIKGPVSILNSQESSEFK